MALFVCFSSINKELSLKLKNKSLQNKNIHLKKKSKPPLFESMVFKNAPPPLNNVKQCRGLGMATVLSTTVVFSNWNLFTGHWFLIE